MPGEAIPLICLDACVLLSYIDGDEDRAPTIEELFRRSRAGEIDLITSILSRVEVAFDSAEKAGGALDPEVEKNIDALWISPSPIDTVELYDQIASEARALVRYAVEQGWSLKPPDAIHIATATQMQARELFTYDTALPKYATRARLSILEPYNPQEQLPGTENV